MSILNDTPRNNRPTVVQLLDGKHNFVMPSYQRGYRWDSKQVVELLDDLMSYCTDREVKGDYYLQPLVVQHDAENDKWIVLDGQQRLTTVWLILNYLNVESQYIKIYGMERQINRDGQANSLKLSVANLNPCADIQSYYIWEASKVIEDWFEKLGPSQERIKLEIKFALADPKNPKHVRFIWYEQSNSAEPDADKEQKEIENIKFFNRLNNGKIGLTSAELIKALFVLAFEKQKSNYTERALSEEALIQEWDRMEARLQDNKFASMLSKDFRDYGCRMDILFDFITNRGDNDEKDHAYQLYQKLFDHEAHYDNDNPEDDTYPIPEFWKNRKVNSRDITSMQDAWTDVKNTFDMLCEWYNDPLYYHYIGYLVHCGKSIQTIYARLADEKNRLLKEEKWTGQKKLHALKKLMLESVFKKEEANNKETSKKDSSKIDVADYVDTLDFDKNKATIRSLLLLFNIEIYRKSRGYRFDFESYSDEDWDIEHIASRNKERLQDRREQMAWLRHAREILSTLTSKTDALSLAAEIEEFLKSKDGNDLTDIQKPYQEFYGKVRNLFRDEADKEVEENWIGNFTLLNSSINREYKDDPFFFKRQTIIDKDKSGVKFIPMGTRNVFLKYYSDSRHGASHIDVMKWSVSDGVSYRNAIVETIKNFINEN